jgi:hypothetical protein
MGMNRYIFIALSLASVIILSGCPKPDYNGPSLIPGPLEEGYDAALEQKVQRYDRQHLIFNCAGNGINNDVVVPVANTADRQLIADFLQNTDSWDFAGYSGREVFDVIPDYQPTAGLYAGVGIAADAYRYAVLRDSGYAQADVDRAREFLKRDISGLFVAVEITGVEGVIARGFCRTDIPTSYKNAVTTPLFDSNGNPLPEVKNNGTLRSDNSVGGKFPNYVWSDSCSRDQYIGWATAFAAVWEAVREDPSIPKETKDRLQLYAKQLGHSLMVERTGGPGSLGKAFDLEIFDADGRTTFHGYINENNWDRIYLAWLPVKDGFYSMMALGIVAALNYCSEDPELDDYLYDELIAQRHLDDIIVSNVLGYNLDVITNYSATNMVFQGALLAGRYISDEKVREKVRFATIQHLYNTGISHTKPREYSYSLYDFVYAANYSGASAFNKMKQAPDFAAVGRGIDTLYGYHEPPYWDYAVVNCDDAEIASGECTLNDGTKVKVLGNVGRNGDLITEKPIPQSVRPPSNYHWRSNPYCPNGGGNGSCLLPGVDLRFAYWFGRFVK